MGSATALLHEVKFISSPSRSADEGRGQASQQRWGQGAYPRSIKISTGTPQEIPGRQRLRSLAELLEGESQVLH